MAGDSPTIDFTVECHPPFLKEPLHSVCKKKTPTIANYFTVDSGNTVTFPNVQVGDSGLWAIKCTNPCGFKIGEKSFELEVYPPGNF